MLRLPSLGEIDHALPARIYLATGATDMRKGLDSLAALVRDHLGHDPLSGSLFLFVGRDKDRIKILYWDTDNGKRGQSCSVENPIEYSKTITLWVMASNRISRFLA